MIKTDLRPSSIARMPIARSMAASIVPSMATNWRKSRTLALETQICLRATCRLKTRVLLDAYSESDDASTGHRVVMLDIEVDSSQGYPNIEKPKQAITAIALYDATAKHYTCFVLDEDGLVESKTEGDKTITAFEHEEDLLMAFLTKWEEIAPTIATGWNIDGFDFPYLHARLVYLFDEIVAGRLSPIGICDYNQYKQWMTIAGVNCLDDLLLYRRYSQKNLPNYRLDTVGKEELKIGKGGVSGLTG